MNYDWGSSSSIKTKAHSNSSLVSLCVKTREPPVSSSSVLDETRPATSNNRKEEQKSLVVVCMILLFALLPASSKQASKQAASIKRNRVLSRYLKIKNSLSLAFCVFRFHYYYVMEKR